MLKPALAALAFAAMAAISGGAQAHDTNTGRYGVFGAPFFYDFAHRGDDRNGRYDRNDRERHVHFRNGNRLVHEHKFKKRSHKHGKGWGQARFPRDGWTRHSDRRDHRWDRHDHRREAQRHDGRHDHDARDHNHRREAQRHDHDRDRDGWNWRDSRRDDDRRWRDRRWNNDN